MDNQNSNGIPAAAGGTCGVSQEGKKVLFFVSYSEESVKGRIEQIAQMPEQEKASRNDRTVHIWAVERLSLLQQARSIVESVNKMDVTMYGYSLSDTASMGGMDVLLGQQADAAFAAQAKASSTTPYINEREWLLEGLEFVHHNRAELAERRAVWVYWKVLREKGQLARISTTAELARTLRKLLSGQKGTRKTVCGADSVEPSHVFKNVPAALKNAPLEQWEEAARGDPTLQRYVVFKHKAEAFVEEKRINVPPHR